MVLRKNQIAVAWLVATLFAYYALLFSSLGNYFHGGGPVDKVLVDASAVLSVFFAIDFLRSDSKLPAKIGVCVLSAPLAFYGLAALYFGVTRALAI